MDLSNFNYKKYWEDNYKGNGNSGLGSYGSLADFKSSIVNKIIEEYQVKSTIEFGCGDGNQIRTINYGNYIGFDVSPTSVEMCGNIFKSDSNKKFLAYDPLTFNSSEYSADMVVCLDVLYHITIEEDFVATLNSIFNTARKVVVLYTKLTTSYAEYPDLGTIVDRDIYSYLKKYESFKVVDTIHQNLGSSASFLIMEKVI